MQTHHDTAVVQGTTSIVAAYAAANKSSPEEITKLAQDLMQVLGQVGAEAGSSIAAPAGSGKSQAHAGVLEAVQGSADGEDALAASAPQTYGETAPSTEQAPQTSAASEVADATSRTAEAGMLAVDTPQRGRGRGGRRKAAGNTPAEPAQSEVAAPAQVKTGGRRGRKASATAALDFAAPAGDRALEGEIILPSKPVVPVEGSVERDTITCLICGNKYRLLALHLDKKHSITFAEYKERYDLQDDYPSSAESYRLGAAEKAKAQGFADQSREVRNGRAAHSQTQEAIKKRNQRAKKAAAKAAVKEKERQRLEKLEARRRGQAASGRTRKAAANAA